MLAVDVFLMGCTDKQTVDGAMSLMRRFHGHGNLLAVERRVQTLTLEEVDPVAPQVNRVQEKRSRSLNVE